MEDQPTAPRFNQLQPASRVASRTKRRNKAQGSKAELALRQQLWSLGLRYRLHAKDLPGKPDIVFRRQRLAVFVDGDFWHGRDWEARRRKLAKGHNAEYWLDKIAYNRVRDHRNTEQLEGAGWRVIRFWETDVKRAPRNAAAIVQAALS
ncbi:very short patch repair endonuclease [uncultured Thiohalocapsa sp.]|uniref:very short patch repair endonuclease n=1 Tax=uncultured Thiohalocapsa sp. TaxID=768990 RepID=UPI0025EA2EFB|nr:very short patch repair endonuclease [uncultured Thiohalocapsa sp.]